MNVLRVIQIATVGWRTAVPPTERLELLDEVSRWVAEQRSLALAQQRAEQERAAAPHDFGFGPSVHRARERGER